MKDVNYHKVKLTTNGMLLAHSKQGTEKQGINFFV